MDDEEGLNQENFEKLLAWLDPDREKAGTIYENIRETLIQIFTWRGCKDADYWADKTVNRVLRKLPSLLGTYTGDPARYFYGVARKLLHECYRQEEQHADMPVGALVYAPEEDDETGGLLRVCLGRCLEGLAPEDRELFLAYYQYDKKTKIKERKELAGRHGLEMSELRARIFEIRLRLAACIRRCVRSKTKG